MQKGGNVTKQLILVGVLLLLSLLTTGCDAPQKNYDYVLAKLNESQAKVESLQSELVQVQSELSVTESNLIKAQNQIESLESDLVEAQNQIESTKGNASTDPSQPSSFKSDLNNWWDSFEKKGELARHLIKYWAAAALDDNQIVNEMTVDMVIFVEAVGNTELSQLWQDLVHKPPSNLWLRI